VKSGCAPRQSRQRLHSYRPSRSAGCSQGRRSRRVACFTLDGGRRGGYLSFELTRTFADLTACQIESQLLHVMFYRRLPPDHATNLPRLAFVITIS
jgi:hypothetical protein